MDELDNASCIGLCGEGYGASLHLGISPALRREGSEQLRSWEAVLVIELNGRGASLISLLVSNYLPIAFIASQC